MASEADPFREPAEKLWRKEVELWHPDCELPEAEAMIDLLARFGRIAAEEMLNEIVEANRGTLILRRENWASRISERIQRES